MSDPGNAPVGGATVVWIVHEKTGHSSWSRGVSSGTKGLMTIETDRLLFRPDLRHEGDTRIPLQDVRKVKRSRFTPVIELRLTSASLPKTVWFYFTQPPDLGPGDDGIAPKRIARLTMAEAMSAGGDATEWAGRIAAASKAARRTNP